MGPLPSDGIGNFLINFNVTIICFMGKINTVKNTVFDCIAPVAEYSILLAK